MSMLVNRCANRLLSFYSVQRCVCLLSTDGETAKAAKKKKKPLEVRINVIENASLKVMNKEDANKLATRRSLVLTPIDNPETWMLAGNREAFQLQTPFVKVKESQEDQFKAKGFKGMKQAVLRVNIQEHDLATKIKQIQKWLASGFVTDVAIDTTEKTDSILERIQEAVKDSAILPGVFKKRNKNLVRIQYEPLKKINQNSESTSEEKSQS